MSENKKRNVYGYCGTAYKAINEFWRNAFLSKICNMQIPDDIEIIQLTEEEKSKIQLDKYTPALAHILILFGAGYVEFDTVAAISKSSEKYTDLIFDTENFVIGQAKETPAGQVSEDIVRSAFMCAYNSIRYEQIQEVDFDTARDLHGCPKFIISGGFVFPNDKEFLVFLVNAGEPVALFDKKAIDILNVERISSGFGEESYTSLVRNTDKTFPNVPFILNIRNAMYISEIYGKSYAADFIKFARENHIPFDKNFSGQYEEYIRKEKLRFVISVISKKRAICDKDINWFDYGATEYEGTLLKMGEEFDKSYEIDLDIDISPKNEPSEEQLINMAVEKFLTNNTLAPLTVMEITHSGNKHLFVCNEDGSRTRLNSEKFRTQPFNLNDLWTVVMEWSRKHLIVKKNDRVTIPMEEWAKVPPEKHRYAQRMIEEQYMRHKGQNGVIQTLSSLTSYAKKKNESRAAREKGQAEVREQVQKKGENNNENSDS